MKDEIKDLLQYLKNVYESEETSTWLNKLQIKDLLDYITNLQEKCESLDEAYKNLQEELEVSQTNEETFRLEMQDITKCLGLDKHTIFDEVKEYATNLQEENEGAILIGKELNKENERLRKELELCKKNGEI